MLNNLQNPLALVARILLALMFVLGGISKIGGSPAPSALSRRRGCRQRRSSPC